VRSQLLRHQLLHGRSHGRRHGTGVGHCRTRRHHVLNFHGCRAQDHCRRMHSTHNTTHCILRCCGWLHDTTANSNTRTNNWHHRYRICSITRRRCSCHLTIINTRRTVDGSQGERCGHITNRWVGGRRTDAANRYRVRWRRRRVRPAQASASAGATHACDSTTRIGSDTGSEVSNGSYGRA
jgi:hypothetical protein